MSAVLQRPWCEDEKEDEMGMPTVPGAARPTAGRRAVQAGPLP
ncbi:hypothetical protein [Oerskovia turbata]|nr:hypothetical protein [Oerskovia turbata]